MDAVTPKRLTDEGMAIIDRLRNSGDNIGIEALSGCGKTTMMENVATEAKEKPSLYIAFAKSDVEEAKKRFPSTTKIQTINGLGHGVWRQSTGRMVIDINKMKNLLREELNALKGEDEKEISEAYWDILSTAAMAKHLGYIPDGKYEHARRLCNRETLAARVETKLSSLAWEIVDSILFASIQTAYHGTCDFDDQIYMPALFGGTFPRYPLVLIDERQDLSPANHAMLDKLCKGRVASVGDRFQSIYYFRGAELGGSDKLNAKFNMVEMPLSLCFRCPKAIVEAARWRAPNLKWVKDGGRYEILQRLDLMSIPEGYTDENGKFMGPAIICRNNAPLLRCAFALLSRKRSVQVAGSDIGPKIIRLLRKIGSEDDSQEDLVFKINAWREAQLETTNAPKSIDDTAECLKVFTMWGANLREALGYAEHIFKQQGTITLTTGHKAKGKEWDVVYHLDPGLIGADDQDLNLRYVIQTRAKCEAYEISSEGLQ